MLEVDDHFEFLGWVPNAKLRQLYRLADVFVMPSLVEAFGVVFLEAMASGTPVVGTRVGGIPELIRHGQDGLLAEVDQPDDLADKLLVVLEDPHLAEQLGTNGRARAQDFGIEQMLACTYHVYDHLRGELS